MKVKGRIIEYVMDLLVIIAEFPVKPDLPL